MTNLSDWKVNRNSLTASTASRLLVGIAVTAAVVALPTIAFGSVEGSLLAVQEKLVGTILPLAAICGLVVAGFSFVAGHPNARQHLSLAIMGAIIGFGAESIVALIRSLIQ
jgi:type IV secretory pathway VirB2 component (pilin)